jgi:hypothetical protein
MKICNTLEMVDLKRKIEIQSLDFFVSFFVKKKRKAN